MSEFLQQLNNPVTIATIIAFIFGSVATFLKGKYGAIVREMQDVAEVFSKAKKKKSEKGRDLSRDEYRELFNEAEDVLDKAFFTSYRKDK